MTPRADESQPLPDDEAAGGEGRPYLDPELAAALEGAPGRPDLTPRSIALHRSLLPPGPSDETLRRGGEVEVEVRRVPGVGAGAGAAEEVELLFCRPAGVPRPAPALYFMHSGGLVMGDSRTNLQTLVTTAAELGAVVVSVAYRLAPEDPYPAAVEDCYAGFRWVAEHAAETGVDPDRVVLYGRVAGGGLAAATALLARDLGGPAPLGQVLVSPMLDDRVDTPSAVQPEARQGWNRTAFTTAWTALLGDRRGTDDVPPYAAPARATDLSELPPALVTVGSAEVTRDEAVAYATALWRAGGSAELHVWPGAFHGSDELVPRARLSRRFRAAVLEWTRDLLGG